jgi:PIN domain nuclease of toxin-antitoxin system
MIMLDTHIAVALYEGRIGALSTRARRLVDREPAAISPGVLLELELLHEIRRIRLPALAVASRLRDDLSIPVATDPFDEIARAALPLAFTRDPFDRLIVAHAMLRQATLLTLDEHITAHFRGALH